MEIHTFDVRSVVSRETVFLYYHDDKVVVNVNEFECKWKCISKYFNHMRELLLTTVSLLPASIMEGNVRVHYRLVQIRWNFFPLPTYQGPWVCLPEFFICWLLRGPRPLVKNSWGICTRSRGNFSNCVLTYKAPHCSSGRDWKQMLGNAKMGKYVWYIIKQSHKNK